MAAAAQAAEAGGVNDRRECARSLYQQHGTYGTCMLLTESLAAFFLEGGDGRGSQVVGAAMRFSMDTDPGLCTGHPCTLHAYPCCGLETLITVSLVDFMFRKNTRGIQFLRQTCGTQLSLCSSRVCLRTLNVSQARCHCRPMVVTVS